jgi:cytochrome c553
MKLLSFIAAATFSLPALADRLPIPADAPPAFRAECGSCHLAFPPTLLAADDWRRVMSSLDRHYGDNASLDDATRRTIEDFLVRNAGSGRRTQGTGAGPGVLPRLTLTGWFRHEHDEVPAAVWKDKSVGSAANCAACHTRAEQGSFRGREIRMPGIGGGRRHERD